MTNAVYTPSDEPVIIAQNVWKRYVQNEYRPSLRHEATEMLKGWFGRRSPVQQSEPFWALKDVNFTVHKGEAVGVIGHNGAGKSTLFRILCGVTEPTQGEVLVKGRFAPLLALGAGFNRQLTGKQNIYLNAAIQGLSEREITELLPDIIDFSELGAFIDIPVKRYSSGMLARLGFSVAIHTLPDIVFLDEVLAVGDAAFQEKCKERIANLKHERRTLMLVSHASGAIRMLCDRVIWMHHGEMRMDGATEEVLSAYEAMFGLPSPNQQVVL